MAIPSWADADVVVIPGRCIPGHEWHYCEGGRYHVWRGNDVDPERMDEWLEEFMSSPLPEQFVSEETAAVCVGGAWGKIALDDICALKQDVEERWTSYVKQ